MEPAFWHERWQHNRIGFHLDEVNPYLLAHWATVGPAPPARVFVPLAGKTLDMPWLAGQGYEVVGNEISPIAVEAFFAEQGLTPRVEPASEGLTRWQAGGITLLCGDFMQLGAADLGHVDAVYDRAALISLPAPRRAAYVEHMRALVGRVPQLLITLEYASGAMDGPPFSVAPAEVRTHYEPDYAVEELARWDILQHSPRLRERGLDALFETVYRLRPR